MKSHDVIVVGLGAMGSATLYQLARRGIAAIGIDRFAPPHDRGSSHGESRITRQAIGEGEEYVPFALRSHEIWRGLEAESGRSLFAPVGGLIIGRRTDAGIHGHADFIGRTIAAAKRFRIEHEVLAPGDVMARYPQFQLDGDETCYYEPGAGFLRPELCVETQLNLARARGAMVRTGETVLRVSADATSATVVTNLATYTANSVVVSAGPWIGPLLGGAYASALRVYPQTLYWFAVEAPAVFTPPRFPIFIWRHGVGEDDHFYGFPIVGEGVKLATEQFSQTVGADEVRESPSPADAARMYEAQVRGRLAGVSPRHIRAVTCLYTVTPGFGFVIDRHPDWERVVVASPCSGHGFKHSAAIGEAIAELVTEGRSALDLSPFSMARVRAYGNTPNSW
ncbi:MAG TPA: N-methyl-L-tryptophan oxidase [Vicinamibacterales bacterium]|nr:N-methyl-L-tryptophan oxidase [Vicinamibacterales bacterium]